MTVETTTAGGTTHVFFDATGTPFAVVKEAINTWTVGRTGHPPVNFPTETAAITFATGRNS